MKKSFLIMCLILMLSFIGITRVKAVVGIEDPSVNCQKTSDNKYWDCKMVLYVSGSASYNNNYKITVRTTNATMGNPTSVNKDFKITKVSDGFNVEYLDKAIPIGKYTLFNLRFTINNLAEDCSIGFAISEQPYILRTCAYYEGYYYDGSANRSTSKTDQYRIDCEDNKCIKIGNYYFDGSGNKSTTKTTQYSIDCEEHKCEKVGNVYFDKDGKQVNATQFETSCGKKICEKIDNVFYGKNGDVVTEDVYNEECAIKLNCEKLDNKYYDKDGKEITEEEYNKVCLNYKCIVIEDKYYNKSGDVVSKKDYEIDCMPKMCTVIEDKYYDNDGNEVTKEVYEEKCVIKYNCVKEGDKYYNNEGKEVSKEEFEKACVFNSEVKNNPQTGATIPLITLISFIFIGAGIILITKKTNPLKQI